MIPYLKKDFKKQFIWPHSVSASQSRPGTFPLDILASQHVEAEFCMEILTLIRHKKLDFDDFPQILLKNFCSSKKFSCLQK